MKWFLHALFVLRYMPGNEKGKVVPTLMFVFYSAVLKLSREEIMSNLTIQNVMSHSANIVLQLRNPEVQCSFHKGYPEA